VRQLALALDRERSVERELDRAAECQQSLGIKLEGEVQAAVVDRRGAAAERLVEQPLGVRLLLLVVAAGGQGEAAQPETRERGENVTKRAIDGEEPPARTTAAPTGCST